MQESITKQSNLGRHQDSALGIVMESFFEEQKTWSV